MRAGRRGKIENESAKDESLRHISTISTICARHDMRLTIGARECQSLEHMWRQKGRRRDSLRSPRHKYIYMRQIDMMRHIDKARLGMAR